MCGITGLLDRRLGLSQGELEAVACRMTDALIHRGPDGGGLWVDRESGMALGHRRLSIVDLSDGGHQPMVDPTGRYVLTYNGEIYNYRALSEELEERGHRFRGTSDTEVALAAFLEWGFTAALARFNGMFAIGLWDTRDRVLRLARDRMGEKPLYYGYIADQFVFASELKAICAHPSFSHEIDRGNLALYMRHSHVPAAGTIYRGIRKLPPGTTLTLAPEAVRGISIAPEPVAYWSMRDAAEAGLGRPFTRAEDAVDEVEALMRDAVRLRMQADVSVGAFLSSGIDSSTVVSLMCGQSARPVKTFTLGLDDPALDESRQAAAIAAHLGAEHTSYVVTPRELIDVIPLLPRLYDEPFADSSQVPTYLVSKLARQSVTVALSGDGGDELFAGYHRHFWRMWQRVERFPRAARGATASVLRAVAGQHPIGASLGRVAGRLGPYHLRDKLYKLSTVVGAESVEALYHGLVSHWSQPIVYGGEEPLTAITDPRRWANIDDPTQRIMYLDAITYLPDDILTKLDRASMGVGLEARAAMLDHRLVEMAWRVPVAMNLRHPRGKWILRQILGRHVPDTLTDVPKKGFGIPIGTWLRGPLRPWAEDLLSEHRLAQDGYLAVRPVRRLWEDFLAGGGQWEHSLWTVLMFQAWLGRWGAREQPTSSSAPEIGSRPGDPEPGDRSRALPRQTRARSPVTPL